MWTWDYEEDGTNIRDGARGTVTGGCSKGIFLALEDGQEAFLSLGYRWSKGSKHQQTGRRDRYQ